MRASSHLQRLLTRTIEGTTPEVTAFIGFLLVTVGATMFGTVAATNLRRTRSASTRRFWSYLVLASLAGVAFGLAGGALVFVTDRHLVAAKYSGLLFFIAFIAFGLREVYYSNTGTAVASPYLTKRTIRLLEFGYMATIILESYVVLTLGLTGLVKLLQAGASVLFAAYGVWFGERVEATMTGTPLDTLTRFLVPVIVIAAFLGASDFLHTIQPNLVVLESATTVFLVVTATFLVSATIRLQHIVA